MQQTTSGELFAEARRATTDARNLGARYAQIQEEIAQTKAAIADARIEAARDGREVRTAAPDETATLDALRDELDVLPEQLFGLEERGLASRLEAERVLRDELAPEVEAAKAEHQEKERAAREAQQEAERAKSALGRVSHMRHTSLQRARETARSLEEVRSRGVKSL